MRVICLKRKNIGMRQEKARSVRRAGLVCRLFVKLHQRAAVARCMGGQQRVIQRVHSAAWGRAR